VTVADTSLLAFDFNARHGITAATEQKVIEGLTKAGEPLTRQEITQHTGMVINTVCGAVNALVNKYKLLVELPRRKCRVTGRQAHPVALPVHLHLQPVDERDAQAEAPDAQLSFWGGDEVVTPRRMD